MILPATLYQANLDLEIKGTLYSKKTCLDTIPITLPKGEAFKISIWTNPSDDWIQIELTNPGSLEHTFQDIYNPSLKFTMERMTIENNCQLITDFGQAIYFYSANDAFGEFSNFSDHGIELEQLFYPTVEHFYQAQKFENPSYSEKIRCAPTPKDASILGKSRAEKLKEDWDILKNEIMMLGVQQKFETHHALKELLLSTKNQLLIESSPYDYYWGIGQQGNGFNHLGTLLMRVRMLLQ